MQWCYTCMYITFTASQSHINKPLYSHHVLNSSCYAYQKNNQNSPKYGCLNILDNSCGSNGILSREVPLYRETFLLGSQEAQFQVLIWLRLTKLQQYPFVSWFWISNTVIYMLTCNFVSLKPSNNPISPICTCIYRVCVGRSASIECTILCV